MASIDFIYHMNELQEENAKLKLQVSEYQGLLDALLDEAVPRYDGKNIDINPAMFTRIMNCYDAECVKKKARSHEDT